jgi:hypothetical protein
MIPADSRPKVSIMDNSPPSDTAPHAPHPNPLPLMREREREFLDAPLMPMQQRQPP